MTHSHAMCKVEPMSSLRKHLQARCNWSSVAPFLERSPIYKLRHDVRSIVVYVYITVVVSHDVLVAMKLGQDRSFPSKAILILLIVYSGVEFFFNATRWPDSRSSASYTVPKPPPPI